MNDLQLFLSAPDVQRLDVFKRLSDTIQSSLQHITHDDVFILVLHALLKDLSEADELLFGDDSADSSVYEKIQEIMSKCSRRFEDLSLDKEILSDLSELDLSSITRYNFEEHNKSFSW